MIARRTVFGLALAALSLVAATAPAQEIKLTLADQNAPGAWGPSNALRPWIQKVSEATKGRVTIEVYPSQTLVKGPDIWKAVRSGIVDLGWCFHGYWADLTPLSDVITLPGLPMASAEKGSEVLWRLYERFPAIRKEYADAPPLFLWTSNPYFLLTSKKQVKTLEDIRGLKIRVTGGPPTDQIRALGAVPTPVPMPDVYQALDKGVIDGMGAPWEAVQGFRIYEVAKYYTMVPLSAVYFSLCANKQKMDSLPKDVRDAIASVSGLGAAKFWGRNFFDTAEQAVIEKAATGRFEMVRYAMPAEETARWTKVAGEPIWSSWVSRMEGKGFKEAREILDTTIQLLKN
ncbi:MAG: TRAP transporter substrate-binding protein [Hyphomicrobiales bacterium]|nr:TRAP transporter substrate-binding protein [Hyphomicrobiales bacterium]